MDDDDGTVITFRPRGGAPPGLPPLPPLPGAEPPEPDPADDAAGPGDAPAEAPGRDRTGARGHLEALRPGPALPALPGAAVPATFRAEGDDGPAGEDGHDRPHLGALGLAAALAVALAAMRGVVTTVAGYNERRLARHAEGQQLREARLGRQLQRVKHESAMQGIREQIAQTRARPAGIGRASSGSGGGGGSTSTRTGGTGGGAARGASAQQGPAGRPSAPGRPGASPGPSGARPGPALSTSRNGVVAPTRGRSGDEKSRHAAVERARGRSALRAARDKAKHQRIAAEHAQGLTERSEDRARALKDQQRISREKRRAHQQRHKARAKRRKAQGVVTLPQALGNAAQRRWDARRAAKNPPATPAATAAPASPAKPKGKPKPKLKAPASPKPKPRPKKPKGKPKPPTAAGAAGRPPTPPAGAGGAKPGARKKGRKPPPPTGPGPSARRKARRKARHATPGYGTAGRTRAGHRGGPGAAPPPRGPRRGARAAAEDLRPREWVVIERLDTPDPTRITVRVALPPATPVLTAAPRKDDTPVSVTVPTPRRAPAPSGEHATEVTIDDALGQLGRWRKRCQDTHEECVPLAVMARKLRDGFLWIHDQLAGAHNVRSRLVLTIANRLAESMDRLATNADKMRAASLRATELIESLHRQMHDAYKPVQQATADAGLHTPSARVHNED